MNMSVVCLMRSSPWLCLLAICLGLVSCSGVERAGPRPESAARADRSFALDVPQIMRGTVASEAILVGYEPVVVRGFGLVVGLNGTGSRDIPPAVRAHMTAEMARHGIGSERSGYGHLRPDAMLNSLDTAVVIVEAIIPPASVGQRKTRDAAIMGTQFDVRIYAHPQTGTTSLEGGQLYTTQLRPGPLRPGGGQAAPIAHARGPIFVNPFAEPDAIQRDAITRTTGVILNGGEVLKDIPIKLRLANPSHTRAAILQDSINARFPRQRAQPETTARGESDESVAITVPPSFRENTEEFVNLLRHTTIRMTNPEAVAVSIRRMLLDDPSLALSASYRWQALGVRAIPVIQELYDHPEELPRLAALRAGAKLDDALVVPHLIDMAESASAESRSQAITLLADMQHNPRINVALRELLNDSDVDVRLSAYEALIKRRDPYMQRYAIGGKFYLDIVESDKPMIYVTQFGQPRVVLFGADLSIQTPVLVQAWSNRLMIKDNGDDDRIEVFYRQNPSDVQAVIHRVQPQLDEFIHFLGHTTTIEKPAPGLGLTYGETVGALYQIWSQKYIHADFKAEQDRILAAIVRHEQSSSAVERPEFTDPDSEVLDSEFYDLDASVPGSDLDRLAPAVPPSRALWHEPSQ
jgi:flagellar basal body P-ring protein FlgI